MCRFTGFGGRAGASTGPSARFSEDGRCVCWVPGVCWSGASELCVLGRLVARLVAKVVRACRRTAAERPHCSSAWHSSSMWLGLGSSKQGLEQATSEVCSKGQIRSSVQLVELG